ncbi:MAG: hypothetical protein F9B45_28580 [Phycisphaera sp. RhM]|nr:hypothetical protein [Phycisphaera sp. RhM]
MTAIQSTEKPAKPYASYPLTAHKSGQWRKRYKGRDYYCGPWNDPEGALEEWERIRASLTLGIDPAKPDHLTIEDLCDLLTASKEAKHEIGELSHHTLADYKSACKHLLARFGKHRPAESFTPADFDTYRSKFPKHWGTASILKQITLTRGIFKWGYDNGHIDRIPRYGENFSKPKKRVRNAEQRAKAKKEFTGAEVYALLHEADPQFYAMILLGLNVGFGNADCARLQTTDINGEWIETLRGKTGTHRKGWLWPETRKALRDVERFHKRSGITPAKGCESLVFRNHDGTPWVSETQKFNAITNRFAKIKRAAKCHRPGCAFYSFRHMFESIAGETKDQVCVDHVMGHAPADNDMGAIYRNGISDDRIKAVCEHVRAWFIAAKPKRTRKSQGGAK